MGKVQIQPMPKKYKKHPMLYRPGFPPIFPDCGPEGPTTEDIELAKELFMLLDDESKEWYKRGSRLFKDL